jgi:hypothetical protein
MAWLLYAYHVYAYNHNLSVNYYSKAGAQHKHRERRAESGAIGKMALLCCSVCPKKNFQVPFADLYAYA